MRHRNRPEIFKTDSDWSRADPSMEHSSVYGRAEGRSVAPDNSSLPHPMDNNHEYRHAFHQNMDSLTIQHSTNSTLESAKVHPPISGTSYVIFPQFPPSWSSFPAAEFSASHSHSSHHERHITSEAERGVQDHAPGTTRESFKRKNHVSWERGSRSDAYDAGSSSTTFELQREETTSDYRNRSSSSSGLPPHMGGSFEITDEDCPRSVRIRSRLDLESNSSKNYSSSRSSGPYYSTSYLCNYHGPADTNAGAAAHRQNHVGVSPSVRWFQSSATGLMEHMTDRYDVGGRSADNGRYHLHGSVLSRNNAGASHIHDIQAQDYRETQVNRYKRNAPTDRTNLPSLISGQEAAALATDRRFFSNGGPSRCPRPMPAGGRRSRHRERRSGVAIERFRSLSTNAHDGLGSEGVMARSRSYGSRNLFDQYREMRLDVDSMSYEDLLALGDRIGNVNTGLSEEAIFKCLTICPCSSIKQEGLSCPICLEEYENGDIFGKLKNCGHDYHVGCIKKWLSIKNGCPICKAPAAADTSSKD